ncbi:MAG: acetolactate synthase small subunit [Anaerovoracaceae bacterium]|nr:acetolactate synthase small subunit [Bacillota bacterium]MDY2671528.1 acetolactate synthase small subunit [Anaerovoracaceae bacterium]
MKHVLSALMENRPGVLRRLAGLFGRRGYNIDSIVASATENEDVTRMTIVVDCDEQMIDQVVRQMRKLQEIIDVEDVTNQPTISRQLLIIKLSMTPQTRLEILELANAFRARVVDMTADTITLEATGEVDNIKGIVEVLEPYGVISMMKTGTVALKK